MGGVVKPDPRSFRCSCGRVFKTENGYRWHRRAEEHRQKTGKKWPYKRDHHATQTPA